MKIYNNDIICTQKCKLNCGFKKYHTLSNNINNRLPQIKETHLPHCHTQNNTTQHDEA